MKLHFTCPHCDEITEIKSEHVGQTGHCRSCGRSIKVEPDQTGAPVPNYPDPNIILKTTLRGTAAGCCIVVVVTIAYLVVPLSLTLFAALVILIQSQGNDAVARQALTAIAVDLGISCLVGATAGTILMGFCATFLRDSPRMFPYAQRGALLGAIIPPCFVFLAISLPLMMRSGVSDLAVHEQLHLHWRFALMLGAIVSVTAMLLALLFGLVLQETRTTSR
jgi:hypothetical protein